MLSTPPQHRPNTAYGTALDGDGTCLTSASFRPKGAGGYTNKGMYGWPEQLRSASFFILWLTIQKKGVYLHFIIGN